MFALGRVVLGFCGVFVLACGGSVASRQADCGEDCSGVGGDGATLPSSGGDSAGGSPAVATGGVDALGGAGNGRSGGPGSDLVVVLGSGALTEPNDRWSSGLFAGDEPWENGFSTMEPSAWFKTDWPEVQLCVENPTFISLRFSLAFPRSGGDRLHVQEGVSHRLSLRGFAAPDPELDQEVSVKLVEDEMTLAEATFSWPDRQELAAGEYSSAELELVPSQSSSNASLVFEGSVRYGVGTFCLADLSLTR